MRELFGCEVGVSDHSMVVGEVFTPDNLRAIRPGLGLAPKHVEPSWDVAPTSFSSVVQRWIGRSLNERARG